MRISPPVRMKRSGSGAKDSAMWRDSHCLVEHLRLHALGQGAAAGLHHVPAAAVVEGHRQRDAVVVLGQLLGVLPGAPQLVGDGRAVADDADAHAVAGQLGEVLGDRHQHQAHQARDFLGGALPVLGREGEDGEVAHAAVGEGIRRRAPARPRPACGRRSAACSAGAPSGRCRPSPRPRGAARPAHRHRLGTSAFASPWRCSGRVLGQGQFGHRHGGQDGGFRPPSPPLPCRARGGRSRRWCGRSGAALRPGRGARRPRPRPCP